MLTIYFAYSFFLSLLLVPVFKKIAFKLNIIDKPEEARKIHTKPMPYLGGAAVYFSMLITFLIYTKVNLSTESIIIWFLGFIVVIFGTIDDKNGIRATYKFIFQIIIASVTALFITDLDSFGFLGFDILLNQWQAMFVTVAWIVAMMNAFNLIDGLDGLTSGIGIISLSVIAFFAAMIGDQVTFVIALIMIGSLLGFLFYNFYPASIFLGDSGALLLGYYISIYSLGQYKTATATTTAIILLTSFIPIFDVSLSFIRRKFNNQSAFKADALHFHHRLMRKGFSHQHTVLIIYAIMIYYAMIAIIIMRGTTLQKYIIMTVAFISTWLIIEYLYLLSDKYTIIRKMVNKIRRKNEQKNSNLQ